MTHKKIDSEISCCFDCPHFEFLEPSGDAWCREEDRVLVDRDRDPEVSYPEWCPLPDAKESQGLSDKDALDEIAAWLHQCCCDDAAVEAIRKAIRSTGRECDPEFDW